MMGFNSKFILINAVILVLLSSLIQSYLITTPRKWTVGEVCNVCVTLDNPAIPGDYIIIGLWGLKNFNAPNYYITNTRKYFFREGEKTRCMKLFIKTRTIRSRTFSYGHLLLEGSLGAVEVNETRRIYIGPKETQTLLETDKSLYEQSQLAHVRFFSVEGTFLDVVMDEHEISIRSPSDSDFVSMGNVSSTSGLNHWTYQIADDAEEGIYTIKIKEATTNFRVEKNKMDLDLVENLVVKVPKYIIWPSEFYVEVCARNNSGNLVSGMVKVSMTDSEQSSEENTLIVLRWITGCKNVKIIDNHKHDKSHKTFGDHVIINATILEMDEFGLSHKNIYYSKPLTVPVFHTQFFLSVVYMDEFVRPELPFVVKVKVTYVDTEPAVNEEMEICIGNDLKNAYNESFCKIMNTSTEGIIEFAVPPHLKLDTIVITAVNSLIDFHQSKESYVVIEHFLKYHSLSNSSLAISLDENELQCNAKLDTIDFLLPVKYAAVDHDMVSITVQVVSRNHIQFSKTFEQKLYQNTSLDIDESKFWEPMRPPVTKGLVRGSFNLPISLPKTISPRMQILVWYTRNDGEVVADMRFVDIANCLLNDVSLSWSSANNHSVKFSLLAEPDSFCSLGMVDRHNKNSYLGRSGISLDTILEPHTVTSIHAGYDDNHRYIDDDYDRIICNEEEEFKREPPFLLIRPLIGSRPRVKRQRITPWSVFDYDARRMFDISGLHVISDLNLISMDCIKGGWGEPRELLMELFYKHHPTRRPASRLQTINNRDNQVGENVFSDPLIWNLVLVSENGTVDETITLPETNTEWVGNAICVHPTKGIGLSNLVTVTPTE